MTKKLKKLTKEQKEATVKYRDEAIEIGLHATEEPMDEKLVRELTDEHRKSCGVAKATNFITMNSPWAVIEKYGKSHSTITPSSALYGQHDVNWLWFYKFFRDEYGLVKETEPVRHLIELCRHVNWMWMSSDTTIAVRKPVEAHLVTRKRGFQNVEGESDTFDCPTLHNTEGMALKYADDKGLYKLNNIDFFDQETTKLINTPGDLINPADVMRVKNTEQRTELIKKIGMDKVFSKLNKQLLHSKSFDIGGTYELYTMEFGNTDRVYLQGKCPSKRETFLERVPPECKTVDQALQWRQDWALKHITGTQLRSKSHVYTEPKSQS